ncbi:MAG: hypothetical protein ACREQW_25130 [Candidatus Binatia bacterium]
MMPDPVEKIVRAVLYEGSMLYPYRRSALKNRHRWNFGVLFPPNCDLTVSGAESSRMQSECLLAENSHAAISVCVRFLHLFSASAGEIGQAPDERQVKVPEIRLSELSTKPLTVPFKFEPNPVSAEKTKLFLAGGQQKTVQGAVELRARPIDQRVFKLAVRVQNLTPFDAAPTERDLALMSSLVSTHVIVRSTGGTFFSLMDPPEKYRDAAEGWPPNSDGAPRGIYWDDCARQ